MIRKSRMSRRADAAAALQKQRERQNSPRPGFGAPILMLMLLIGGLIGGIIALLFAPQTGKQTRQGIKQNGATLVGRFKPPPREQSDLTEVSNWGNYPRPQVKVYEFENLDSLREIVTSTNNLIVRGNGRCYGDSALAPHIISSMRYNKFLSFDREQGEIRCQAGVLLSEILDVIVPQGWFLAVTPGTKLITVGGAIASDVHGKSQHKTGNFSDHLLEMDIMLGDGSIVTCSPEQNPDLFWTTTGGMGLTGVILHATLKLIPVETAYFKQDSIKAKNLEHLMDLFEESEAWPYSVAWIDCITGGKQMGRGILMRGDHATPADLPTETQRQAPLRLKPGPKLNVPLHPPGFVLNRLSMKIFNTLYYNKQQADCVSSVVDYNAFFYPLDSILNWNRLYGRRGFTQYQFILPKETSREGMHHILQRIVDRGLVSFLAVLKLYGQQNGFLPFAMEGYALALDFPIVDGLFEFLDELDEIVHHYGGRLYLTKDVRMSRQMFRQSYPNVDQFVEKMQRVNQNNKFRSFQSDRIGITT